MIVNPSAFQNGMTLQNRVKIGRAMSKNVRSSNFFGNFSNFLKNFRGLFGALKLKIFLKKRYFWVTLDHGNYIGMLNMKLRLNESSTSLNPVSMTV